PFAIRNTESGGANCTDRLLFGYGGSSSASIRGLNRYFSHPNQKPSPSDASWRFSPIRIITMFRLGITTKSWLPAPAPANASRGTPSQTPSKLLYQPAVVAGIGLFLSRMLCFPLPEKGVGKAVLLYRVT